MKELITYAQDARAIQHYVCSEKTCITCFENRGCMYEQYVNTGVHHMEEPVSTTTERRPERWKQNQDN